MDNVIDHSLIDLLQPADDFARRHIGPDADEVAAMLDALGLPSMEALIAQTVPPAIRRKAPLNLPEPLSESEALAALRQIAAKNKVFRSYIGLGYHGTHTPGVIQRNILENPGWYTQYTPYQPEIAQGRLEALLNFQTMITDLTGLDVANASLLDEGTAAAEAMHLALASRPRKSTADAFFVSALCHPQTVAVVQGRAEPLGVRVIVGDHTTYDFSDGATFGALIQYPDTEGSIHDYSAFCEAAHAGGALVIAATDLLALTLLPPPGAWGADIAVGSAQRFGVPMGFGGPHAAFFAVKDALKRGMPGRLVGVSQDAEGRPALRLALQAREQHIRREKATSNICTAQVLLAVMASMYAVYHGPRGLERIARRVHLMAASLAAGLRQAGYHLNDAPFFDTLKISGGPRTQAEIRAAALERGINLRYYPDGATGAALDETTNLPDLADLFAVFGLAGTPQGYLPAHIDLPGRAEAPYLTHPVFNSYHSETEMLRYIKRLEARDLSLAHSMIALGSCTMKLNATAEMIPVTWPEFGGLHPFAPADQALGYAELFSDLEAWLAEITGFAGVSLQPNAGSQGEYAGLLVIRAYHAANGQAHRNICLIPSSAHGTNPASAVMAGMEVVVVACDAQGNIDVDDLRAKAEAHADRLAALMITYPSTHGVFEAAITDICDVIHSHGGQVYMDGANMNAQVGLCQPGQFGADVCHLNLHKTFCIPHGGGGPGMGPICAAAHLVPYLPGHPLIDVLAGTARIRPISAAGWGSASILPISWMYIRMMGAEGLTQATEAAILNANYIAHRVDPYFPVLYKGEAGRVAHECIIDLRGLHTVTVEDVAKRLIDYGFHAPTMSWPVAGTLMIEPTESEGLAELDRFCEALARISAEAAAVEAGQAHPENNLLANAPHTAAALTEEAWDRPYTRAEAVYPAPWVQAAKFWPATARIDSAYGDRHLICTCLPIEAYQAL